MFKDCYQKHFDHTMQFEKDTRNLNYNLEKFRYVFTTISTVIVYSLWIIAVACVAIFVEESLYKYLIVLTVAIIQLISNLLNLLVTKYKEKLQKTSKETRK